jgi:hypothetical protein
MDQSINTALAQCATLYGQIRPPFQRVVVPVSLEYHFEGPDSADPTFVDTIDVNATGNLVYVPSHIVQVQVPLSGTAIYYPRWLFVPETLSATIQGQGSAQAAPAGGDFSAPAIHVSIDGALPFRGSTANVVVQSSANLVCNLNSPVDESAIPIEWMAPVSGGVTKVVLHLGTAVVEEILFKAISPIERVIGA